jgi:hypothetical protein
MPPAGSGLAMITSGVREWGNIGAKADPVAVFGRRPS